MKNNLLSTKHLDTNDLTILLNLAQKIEELIQKEKQLTILNKHILASLFFEPSTRTRLSFESAMYKLGGNIISVTGKESVSLTKGETIYDSIRMIDSYADILVLRHDKEDAILAAAEATHKPLINAGNGSDEHPTQALNDIYTICKEKGSYENLNITFVGDLKYGRTVHSLLPLLSLHKNNYLNFISPKALSLEEKHLKLLEKRGISYSITENWDAILPKTDILYMTRVQKERFKNTKEYEKYNSRYILTKDIVKSKCKENVVIMHPLPRIEEISTDVDELPNAAYFRQAENAIYVRMAIILLMLGMEKKIGE